MGIDELPVEVVASFLLEFSRLEKLLRGDQSSICKSQDRSSHLLRSLFWPSLMQFPGVLYLTRDSGTALQHQ